MITNNDLNKLKSPAPKIKYGFAKELLKTGATHPELLYPHLNFLTTLIHEKNNILKWTGIDLIGYLSAVDTKNKTGKQIPALITLLHGGHLITCNHAIFALGLIAQNKPQYKKEIIEELLLISKDKFDTAECKNIATGKVLDVFKLLLTDIKENKKVIRFIQNATKNTRNATKKKAIHLIAKIKKISSTVET